MNDSTEAGATSKAQSPLTPQSNNKVSSKIVKGLLKTRKSVIIISCFGFLFCGLQVLALFLLIFASDGLIAQILTQLIGTGNSFATDTGSIAYILIHLFVIWLSFYPAEKLRQYASHIGALSGSYSEQDLVSAIKAQHSYWAFVACLMIITLSLSALGFFVIMTF